MKQSLRLACATLGAVLLGACNDPRGAVENLFRQNGLHLVLPLRSYITLGGLVVVPSSGSPYYVDPLDPIPASMQPGILDFKSVIARQTGSRATGLSAAAGLLQQLVKAPVTFQIAATQEVTLAQIDASGVRMKIPAVQSYIGLPETGKWIGKELAAKAKTFIIYEVYKGKDLTLEAASGQTLNVGLAVGASTAGSGHPAPGGPATPAGGSGQAAPSSAGTPPAAAPPAAAATTTIAPEPACARSGTAAPAAAPATAPATPDGTTASGYWVRTSTLRLALCGNDEYPFAIRVAQVVKNKQGQLELQPGNFKFPGTLGSTDEERYSAMISDIVPIRNLKHVSAAR